MAGPGEPAGGPDTLRVRRTPARCSTPGKRGYSRSESQISRRGGSSPTPGPCARSPSCSRHRVRIAAERTCCGRCPRGAPRTSRWNASRSPRTQVFYSVPSRLISYTLRVHPPLMTLRRKPDGTVAPRLPRSSTQACTKPASSATVCSGPNGIVNALYKNSLRGPRFSSILRSTKKGRQQLVLGALLLSS